MLTRRMDFSDTAVPTQIGGNIYIATYAIVEDLGRTTVMLNCLSDGYKTMTITRKGYMDEHGQLKVNINKHKVIIGLSTGMITTLN